MATNKSEIFKQLKEEYNIVNLTAPNSGFDAYITENILNIHLTEKAVKDNMQNTNSAFESWMLCIMSSNLFKIKMVTLSWDQIQDEKPTAKGYPNKKTLHYHRFLFRVMKCLEYFPDWFSVGLSKKDEIQRFKELYAKSKLVLNYPDKDAQDHAANNEAKIERLLMSKYLPNKFGTSYGQQMPVGVFIDKKASENSFFTRHNSAIDIWGIRDNVMNVIELKYDNIMIGIITETLFYMWICEETFVKGKINYDDSDKKIHKSIKKNYRNFSDIYKLQKKAKTVVGTMLYDEDNIHPLISKSKAIDYINTILKSKNLEIELKSYIYDKTKESINI